MTQTILKFLIAIVSLGVLSCDPVSNEGFDVSLQSSTVILLDATTKSCQSLATAGSNQTTDDVTAIHFAIPKMTATWTGSIPLTIVYVNIKLTGSNISGGEYNCRVSGDQLGYTYFTTGLGTSTFPTPNSSVTIAAGGPALSNSCPFKCSAVTLLDKKKDAIGGGEVFVYAITTDSSGQDIPVTSEAFFQYQFQGIH